MQAGRDLSVAPFFFLSWFFLLLWLSFSSSSLQLFHLFFYQMSSFDTTLFVFRQDLRMLDNTWFAAAVRDSQSVIPLFVFDKRVLSYSPTQDKRLWFLIDALRDLDSQLRERGSRLYVFYGDSVALTQQLLAHHQCDALYYNRSYGDGSRQRDDEIHNYCDSHGIVYKNFDDYLLVEPDEVKAMKVFTPFKKRRLTALKDKLNDEGLYPQSHMVEEIQTPLREHDNEAVYREIDAGDNDHRPIDEWKNRLEHFSFDTYNETRNTLSIDGSSRLSPYLRHGLLSIRQLYNHLKTQLITLWPHDHNQCRQLEVYVSELAWREFWQHIAFHFPDAVTDAFQIKRRGIQREDNDTWLRAWQQWMTGYPLVDAGMRQLLADNWMHNRVRMVVASFLTKDLLIDRHHGDAHFRRYLLDYDRNIDIGNRQRSASVWADPKPLRIFNPSLQAQRFDPQALYIKQRIPELADASPKEIMEPLRYDLTTYGYPAPIVDHDIMRKEAKKRYDHAKQQYEKES